MDDFEYLTSLAKKQKLPKDFRLYLILKDSHVLISNGSVESGLMLPKFKSLKNNRDEVLSVFSKMGFIFDELIRFLIVGHIHGQQSKKLLYVLNLIPLNRKIRLFLDWKIFDEIFTRNMSRLFEVRNGLMHSVNLDVEYRKDKTVILSNKNGWKQFRTDLENAWNELSKIYVEQISQTNWKKII
jgi:hypothetical protein